MVVGLVATVGWVLFYLADLASGNVKATMLVMLGFAVWIILAMSATAWLVAVVWEWRLSRGGQAGDGAGRRWS